MIEFTEKDNVITTFDSVKEFIVTFTGSNCVPCHMMCDNLKETHYIEGLPIYKVPVDLAFELAEKYHIMSVPTTLRIKHGKDVGRAVGFRNKDQLITELDLGEEIELK